MSFKVGDYVFCGVVYDLFRVTKILQGGLIDLKHIPGLCTPKSQVIVGEVRVCSHLARLATPEEIAAGHRIDHSVHKNEMIEQESNASELEVLEMIDVSPNCEVSEI